MASLLDLYRSVFGGEADQGAPMAVQNRQGTFDPYTPAPVPDALELLKNATGITDMGEAYKAYQRGEYLPALGQGAWGAAQAATAALPALRAGGAALKAGAPLAREAVSALPGLLADETGAIRAYHGSPHSFDRFDLSKIGTGEGAQAYGHGLYFAENEGVARGYRDALAADNATIGGRSVRDLAAEKYRMGIKEEPSDLHNIADYVSSYQNNARYMMESRQPELVPIFDKLVADGTLKQGGHMYEVDINAEPHQFLDWDKPLAAQPKIDDVLYDTLTRGGMDKTQLNYLLNNKTGREAYDAVARKEVNADWGAPGDFAQRLASERLREAGIPGIRYLDQGSRGAGAGTSNYAVFDPRIIEIRRKYGLLPPLAGGGLLATQGPQGDGGL